MAFPGYIQDFEAIADEFAELVERVWHNDLAAVEAAERELRTILADLGRSVELTEVAGETRLVQSPKTRRAIQRAQLRVEDWRVNTLAAMRVSEPSLYLTSGKKLAEMRRAYQVATRSTLTLLRRFNQPDRFTPAQIAEAKAFSKERAAMRRIYGDDLEGFFGGLLNEAEFGKAENLAAGVNTGFREPSNFLARFGAATPAGGGIGRVVEAEGAGPAAVRGTRSPYLAGGEGSDPLIAAQRAILRATEAGLDDLDNFLADWRLNRNQLRLSSEAHARGLFNAVFVRLFEAIGVSHFMFYVRAEDRGSRGISHRELFQIRLGEPDGAEIPVETFAERVAVSLGRDPEAVMAEARRRGRARSGDDDARARDVLAEMLRDAESVATWPEVYRSVSQGRNSTVPWGGNLPIHHGSKEFYVPIPPTLLAEARAWSSDQRRELRRAA